MLQTARWKLRHRQDIRLSSAASICLPTIQPTERLYLNFRRSIAQTTFNSAASARAKYEPCHTEKSTARLGQRGEDGDGFSSKIRSTRVSDHIKLASSHQGLAKSIDWSAERIPRPQFTKNRSALAPGTGTTDESEEEASALRRLYGSARQVHPIRAVIDDTPERDLYRRAMATHRYPPRPEVVAAQMYLRREAIEGRADPILLEKIPNGKWRRTLTAAMASKGYTRQEFEDIARVLAAESDDERIRQFLQLKGYKPMWLLTALVQKDAKIRNPGVLKDLIAYCHKVYHGRRDWVWESKGKHIGERAAQRSRTPMLNMEPTNLAKFLRLLAAQCVLVDGRLLINVSLFAAQYIQNMSEWEHEERRIHYEQCVLFDEALDALAPTTRRLPSSPNWPLPMAYCWEAQKHLLSLSALVGQHLQVGRRGFEAVRRVLARTSKNSTEVHNSLRQAQTWPPYLEPTDGIDEATEPEDNWSRTVSAGALQQEAGYPLNRQDEVLNTLQGWAPDGTPTIQQNLSSLPHPRMGLWEARIRATRNREEAWARFLSPPNPGDHPTIHVYAAMLAKLQNPEVHTESNLRPGDAALNFPVRADTSLSDSEIARRKPPTVSELYLKMRNDGLKPSGRCLELLVSGAPSISQAHAYLEEADDDEVTWPLLDQSLNGPGLEALEKVPMPLIAAYIKCVSKLGGSELPRQLVRAVAICDDLFEHPSHRQAWAAHMWTLLLKTFSLNARGFRHVGWNATEQVRVCLMITRQIQKLAPLRLPTIVQYSRGLRMSVGRLLSERITELESDSKAAHSQLRLLYDKEYRDGNGGLAEANHISGHTVESSDQWLKVVSSGSEWLKDMVKTLDEREAQVLRYLGGQPSHTEVMTSRIDPVRAGDAFHLMSCWAMLGEFEMMASYLGRLIEAWDDPKLTAELESNNDLPAFADFEETLCIFRLYAEPMLSVELVNKLREKLQNSAVVWEWPNEESFERFASSRTEAIYEMYERLAHTLEWVRYRQARDRGEDRGTLLKPMTWAEKVESPLPKSKERLGDEPDRTNPHTHAQIAAQNEPEDGPQSYNCTYKTMPREDTEHASHPTSADGWLHKRSCA